MASRFPAARALATRTLVGLCTGLLLANAPCALADNWVDIAGTNKAKQKISVSFEGSGDGHAEILVETGSHAPGNALDFKDQPCERLYDEPVRSRLKECKRAGQPTCNMPPSVNLDFVEMVCSRKSASPLSGTTYKIVRVADPKTCVAFRFECTKGCSSKYVPAVMEQGIDECLD